MPPRASKVPFSSGEHRDFAIPESAWAPIEASYGRKLPATARDQISGATAHYVDMAAAESAAPSSLPAKRRLERLRKLARRLHTELEKRNSLSSGRPEFYADELIYFHLQHPDRSTEALRPGRKYLLLAPVAAEVGRVIAACDAATSELRRTSTPGYWREGSAWNKWIIALSKIMETHRLPSAVSVVVKKGSADQYSPFVRLVAALQQALPSSLRHSTHSQGALTEAIKRARRRNRSD